MSEEKESKIVYREGEELRAIRGKVVHEDSYFIYLSRRDGDLRIAKGVVIKIENWRGANGNGRDCSRPTKKVYRKGQDDIIS